MKRPNIEQIRAELAARRLHEAEATAASDAILDARIGVAMSTLIGARDRDLDYFDPAIGDAATTHAAVVDEGSRRPSSRSR